MARDSIKYTVSGRHETSIGEVVNSCFHAGSLQAALDELRRLGDQHGADGCAAGFAIHQGDPNQGRLAAVAIAGEKWALVLTEMHEGFPTNEVRTDGTSSVESSVEVLWEEQTMVPRRWFVTSTLAVDALHQWLEDGSLLSGLQWSQHVE